MYHSLTAGLLPLVIPVHHHALFAGVDVLVADVLPHGDAAAARLALQLRPPGRQTVVVGQRQREEVGRVLDVLHARLPVQHQKVHAPDGDVPKALPQRRVPEDALDAGTLLELAPPGVAVYALVVGLFQHHRQNVGEELCRLLVVLRPRQHVGLRVVVHGVGVLVCNGVEQPPRAGGALALHHPVAVLLPVAQLVPFLVVDDPLVEAGLGRFVLLQHSHRLADLLLADGLLSAQYIRQALTSHRSGARHFAPHQTFLVRICLSGLPRASLGRGVVCRRKAERFFPGHCFQQLSFRFVHILINLVLSFLGSISSGSSSMGGGVVCFAALMGFSISTYRHSS